MRLRLFPKAGEKGEAVSFEERLTRGALAARTGCNIETIRYYEKIGLLPPPPRSAGGHRLYGRDLVKRLNFVRRSRDLGFTLEEIRELLRLVDGGTYTCGEVEQLARDHVRDIRHKIADLRRLQGCSKRWPLSAAAAPSPIARSSTRCSISTACRRRLLI